jgi:hypothetical protein
MVADFIEPAELLAIDVDQLHIRATVIPAIIGLTRRSKSISSSSSAKQDIPGQAMNFQQPAGLPLICGV